MICKWTRKLWKNAALSVGGSFCGPIVVVLVDTICMYLEYRRLFKESSSLPPYKTTYNRIPALPICSTVASGLVIKKDICCNSSDSVIFFKRLVFPWPYVAEVVSQPLHAWINRRCDVSTSPALLTRSGNPQLQTCLCSLCLYGNIYQPCPGSSSVSSATTLLFLLLQIEGCIPLSLWQHLQYCCARSYHQLLSFNSATWWTDFCSFHWRERSAGHCQPL